MASKQLPRGVTRFAPSRNYPKGGYEAAYRQPGGKERTKRFTRLIDATRWLDAQRGNKVQGTHIDPNAGRQLFLAYADQWASASDWKATSRETWLAVRKRLARQFDGYTLLDVDRLALQGAQKAFSDRYARATVEVTMAFLKAAMKSAYASGRVPRDPTVGLKSPRVRADEDDGKVTAADVPTRAEALAILEAAAPRYRAAIALGIAGLRIGEVLGLSADRLELDQRKVTVDRQLQVIGGKRTLTTPKAEKVRTIVVPGVVAIELRRHLRDFCGDGGMLFRGERSGHLFHRNRFYGLVWEPTLKKAGLWLDATDEDRGRGRFVFHSLRHFCASTLLAEGAPITAVAGHLGDGIATVSTTYAHWLRDDQDVPASVLDRVLAPVAERKASAE